MTRLILGSIIFSFLGIVLQGVVLHSILPSYLIPNFLLILVVFLGFNEVSVVGATLCFCVGIIFDLFSGTLLGPWSGAFIVIYVLLALFAQRLFTRSVATIFISVFFSNAVSTAIYFGLLYQFQPIRGQLLSVSLIESLSSALVAPIIFSILDRTIISDLVGKSSRPVTASMFSLARSDR